MLQSRESQLQGRANAEGFAFLRKASIRCWPTCVNYLPMSLLSADFVFRLADGAEVGRAGDLDAMESQLRQIPVESLIFHGERNDISHWLIARTELALAEKLRPRRMVDYQDGEALRAHCLQTIHDYRREQKQVLVGDFEAGHFRASAGFFLRLGIGSLGGKGARPYLVRHLLHK